MCEYHHVSRLQPPPAFSLAVRKVKKKNFKKAWGGLSLDYLIAGEGKSLGAI